MSDDPVRRAALDFFHEHFAPLIAYREYLADQCYNDLLFEEGVLEEMEGDGDEDDRAPFYESMHEDQMLIIDHYRRIYQAHCDHLQETRDIYARCLAYASQL